MKYVLLGCLLIGLGVALGLGIHALTDRRSNPSKQSANHIANVKSLYDRAARFEHPDRHPVVVIPGLTGTKLVESGTNRVVWGAFTAESVNPENPADARIITLPMEPGKRLAELSDNVVPAEVLESYDVEVAGLSFERRAYVNILRMLGAGGFRDETIGLNSIDYGDNHFTCFQFGYDWRRDIVESAAALHKFLITRGEYIQTERQKRFGIFGTPLKFDIVAHSMGGLVARYYLRYGVQPLPEDGSLPKLTWDGAKLIRRLILIGTPNAGAVESFRTLVDGLKPSSFLPRYQPAHVGTLPSLYQLLPRPRHQAIVNAETRAPIDLYNVATWQQMGWGLLDPKQDEYLQHLLPHIPTAAKRREVACEHLEKVLRRAKALHAALDVPAKAPGGTTIHLFAGDAINTEAVIGVTRSGELSTLATAPGDRTVTRASALMDERRSVNREWTPRLVSPIHWNAVMFLFADHFELTADSAFADNALYLLLEAQEP